MAVAITGLLASCFIGDSSSLSRFCPFVLCVQFVNSLVIFCLSIGQSSFYYQAMRAASSQSTQKGCPIATITVGWALPHEWIGREPGWHVQSPDLALLLWINGSMVPLTCNSRPKEVDAAKSTGYLLLEIKSPSSSSSPKENRKKKSLEGWYEMCMVVRASEKL